MTGLHKICPFLNLFLWTLYLMVLVGYRRAKHYLVMLGVMLVLFGLYAKFVGIQTICQECKPQSKAQSLTAVEASSQRAPEGSLRMVMRRV